MAPRTRARNHRHAVHLAEFWDHGVDCKRLQLDEDDVRWLRGAQGLGRVLAACSERYPDWFVLHLQEIGKAPRPKELNQRTQVAI